MDQPDATRLKPADPAWRPLAVFGMLSPTARLLIGCRLVRSVGQGALVVDFALYMGALGWSAADIGLVYMGGLLFGAALTTVSGPLSDRVGRKPFLIGYDIVQVLAALAALATSQPWALLVAAILGGYGRGANGAAGPFGPVEQAWLSNGIETRDFGAVYSLNTALGFVGMAVGSAVAALPALWRGALPGALAYRPLFLFVAVGSLVALVFLFMMSDSRVARPARKSGSPAADAEAGRERSMLMKLIGVNALNGLGIGIVGPFMAYWFHLRYGVGPAAIGPVLCAGFILSSATALWTGWLTRRIGTTQSVVVMRGAGLVLFVLLPFAPTYLIAAALYVLRSACNRGTAGARQAVGLRLVGPSRRGLAASVNAVSMQVPRALGPVVGGLLLDAQMLAAPLLIAAGLQGLYLLLYQWIFRTND